MRMCIKKFDLNYNKCIYFSSFFMKRFKLFYVVIPLLVLGIALLGQYFTAQWMERYGTLKLLSFTPSGWIIGLVWTIIFILVTISAILFWIKSERDKKFWFIISLFIDNALLNILRTWLFFVKHFFILAIIEMIVLWIFTVMMIIAIYPRSKLASYLLIPYALWLMIATYLAIWIYVLN